MMINLYPDKKATTMNTATETKTPEPWESVTEFDKLLTLYHATWHADRTVGFKTEMAKRLEGRDFALAVSARGRSFYGTDVTGDVIEIPFDSI